MGQECVQFGVSRSASIKIQFLYFSFGIFVYFWNGKLCEDFRFVNFSFRAICFFFSCLEDGRLY